MKSAEYATLRELSGLTVQRIADRLSVTEETAQRWETNEDPPQPAAALVQAIHDWQRSELDRALKAASNSQQQPLHINLLRYRDELDYYSIHGPTIPLEAHHRLIGMIYSHLISSGSIVRIHWFSPTSYSHWLGPRTDTQKTRAQWANAQIS